MNKDLVLVMPHCGEKEKTLRMRSVLKYALEGQKISRRIETVKELEDLQGCRILFAVNLGASGINLSFYAMLKKIRLHSHMFEGCVGGVIVDGQSVLYTKAVARDLVFAANTAGCAFIGRPLVEGPASLANFHILAQINDTDEWSAYHREARSMVERICSTKPPRPGRGEVLVLHASSRSTSNTLMLWEMIRSHLGERPITEICLRNGTVKDCVGCPYKTCLHFGEQNSCFYGGVLTESVYPAIQRCDSLVMLCPNYNDSVSANISAGINRLTALFRNVRFYDKKTHAVIVSGYSGSDIVAGQLIAALNMNKSFYLPPRFCICETANNVGSILKVEGISERAAAFAKTI